AQLADLLIDCLQSLDQVLQGGGIIRVQQQAQAIEQADALRVDAQLLEGLIELSQFLLGSGGWPSLGGSIVCCGRGGINRGGDTGSRGGGGLGSSLRGRERRL